MLTPYVIARLVFVLLMPSGTSVPYSRKPRLVLGLAGLCLLIHIATQLVELLSGAGGAMKLLAAAVPDGEGGFGRYIEALGVVPARLRVEGGAQWSQLLTASLVHLDWLHFLFNAWCLVIFAINLEDLFGRARFALFAVVAMVASHAAAAFLSAGTQADFEPSIGLSGLVYACMGAYMVCFPRSRVRLTLVTSLMFWFCVACIVTPGALIVAMFAGTMWQFAWLALLLGLYVVLQPAHLRVGVPVAAFVAFRVVVDASALYPRDLVTVSAVGQAAGLVLGALAGLAINGTRGFHQDYDDEITAMIAARAREHEEKQPEGEQAAHDEAAMRDYLRRAVFSGDVATANEFYTATVIPAIPQLCLEANLQLQLARMLEARGYWDAALHAYDVLLWNHPGAPGTEAAYLQAADLCLKQADRLADGMRYLNRFERVAPRLRDKAEAKRMREEFEKAAAARKVDLGKAREEVFEGRPEKDGDGPPAEVPPDGFRFAPRATRMQRIEPASQPSDAGAPAKPPRRGAKKLPGSAGTPPQADKPVLADKPGVKVEPGKPDNPGTPVHPRITPEAGADSARLPDLPPRRPLLAAPPDSPRAGAPHDRRNAYDPSPLGDAAAGRDTMPPIAPAVEIDIGSRLADRAARPYGAIDAPPAGAAPPQATHAVLLPHGRQFEVAALLAFFLSRLGADARARAALESCCGVAARGLQLEDAHAVAAALEAKGVPGARVIEEWPAVNAEPAEVLAMRIDGASVECDTRGGPARFAAADVLAVACGRLRISPKSKSQRATMEIVLADRASRFQLWEKTLRAAECRIDGAAPDNPASTPDALLQALSERVPPHALTRSVQHAAGSLANAPAFDSYAAYENHLLAALQGGAE